jgi:hypothetical protein
MGLASIAERIVNMGYWRGKMERIYRIAELSGGYLQRRSNVHGGTLGFKAPVVKLAALKGGFKRANQ